MQRDRSAQPEPCGGGWVSRIEARPIGHSIPGGIGAWALPGRAGRRRAGSVLLWAAVWVWSAAAQEVRVRFGAAIAGGARMGGGAEAGQSVAVWGDGLHVVSGALARSPATWAGTHAPSLRIRRVAGGRYSGGGCWFDGGVVLQEEPAAGASAAGGRLLRMIWLGPPGWRPVLIDPASDFRDCLDVVLFGRRGVLVTHRQMQVRFYERPKLPESRWPYREIYSIYTPSAQAGVRMLDVDGDRRPDLLHGNYWIQAPRRFELGWRLFAFNDWWDGPRTAMLRLAPTASGEIIAAESEASPARLARFSRPSDPKQLWIERRIEVPGGLHRPQALAVAGETIFAGEDNGSGSRLVRIDGGSAVVVATSEGFLEIWPLGDSVAALAREGIWLLPR